jgi:alpha-1,2-glucosyltransferase
LLKKEPFSVVQTPVTLAGRVLPLVLVPGAFLGFVVFNKGIVVGDRTAHSPVLHLMQLNYCAAWLTLSLAPITCTPAR